MMMRRFVFVLAVVWALSAWAAMGFGKEPLRVGHDRQLFLDGRFQEKAKGVELRVHQPIKTGERNIKPDRPWEQGGIGPYSSAMKEGDTYHFWYHAMTTTQWDKGEGKGVICYATSKDGIKWEKPDLGIIEFEGSKKNNIVIGYGAAGIQLGQDGGMVFIDPKAPSGEKYRMALRLKDTKDQLDVFSSADGVHWKLTHPAVITARHQEKGHHLDSQNVMFYDERLGKYVAYVRKNINKLDGVSQGRSVARAESDKLGEFPVAQDMPVVLGPDTIDQRHGQPGMVDYYMSATVQYPLAADAYFMFPTSYYHYVEGFLPEFEGKVPTNAGPLDTQFAASRDGVKWERYGREPFVRLGMKGEFDWASARTVWGVLPDTTGRYLYMYYRASDWLHGWDRNQENKDMLTKVGLGASQNVAVLSRVVLRRDGFVSLRADCGGGEFTTPKLVFDGSRLVLNIDTSATGVAQVEILGESGKPIAGYSLADCDLIHTANDVNRVVSWRGKSDLSGLAGRPVRLRFVMQNVDLYAFEFSGKAVAQ